jgi:TRAP-type C4-dicarboxylate transport system permease small subunit
MDIKGGCMYLTKFCDAYVKLLSVLMLVAGVALIVAVTIQIGGRYVPFIPLWLWPQEIVNFGLVWMIFMGSVVALREKEHFMVDIITMMLKGRNIPPFNVALNSIYYLIAFAISVIFTFYGFVFFRDWGLIQNSDLTGLNLGYIYFAVPFAGISWFVLLADTLFRDIKTGEFLLNKEG